MQIYSLPSPSHMIYNIDGGIVPAFIIGEPGSEIKLNKCYSGTAAFNMFVGNTPYSSG
jgi:hypothetical protein